MKKLILPLLLLFSFQSFTQNYHQRRFDNYNNNYNTDYNYTVHNLAADLQSMEKYAREVLMPRSKKDSKKGKISRRTREHVKKIYAYAKWLQGNIWGSLSGGATLRQVRDDYSKEERFRALNKYTLYAIWDAEQASRADKLYDALLTFFSRFVEPIGRGIGYQVHRPNRGRVNPYEERYKSGRDDDNDPEFYIQIG